MEEKTISYYKEAFIRLLRDAEETLGCDIAEVSVTRTEDYVRSDMWGYPIMNTKYNCKIIIE